MMEGAARPQRLSYALAALMTLAVFGVGIGGPSVAVLVTCIGASVIAYALVLSGPCGGRFLLLGPLLFLTLYCVYVLVPAGLSFALVPGGVLRHNWGTADDRLVAASLVGLFAFVVGVFLAAQALRKWPVPGDAVGTGSVAGPPLRSSIRVGVYVLAGLAFSVTLYFFYFRRDIYLQMLIANQIGGQRQKLRAGAGILTASFIYLLPWTAIVLYLDRRAGGPRSSLWASVASGTVAILAQIALLFRGNVLFSVLLVAAVGEAISRGARRLVVGAVAVAAAMFLALSASRVPMSSWGSSRFVSALVDKVGRRFITPMRQLGWVLDTFPRPEMPPGSTELMDLEALRPGYDISFNGLVFRELGNRGVGTSTVTVVGEGYATAGFAGIALETLVLGFLLQSLYQWFVRGPRTIARIFTMAWLTVYIGRAVLGGVTPFVPQPVVLLIIGTGVVVITAVLVEGTQSAARFRSTTKE